MVMGKAIYRDTSALKGIREETQEKGRLSGPFHLAPPLGELSA